MAEIIPFPGPPELSEGSRCSRGMAIKSKENPTGTREAKLEKMLELHTNRHGQIDIRDGIPAGLEHVPGSGTIVLCPSRPALVGFTSRGRPKEDGYVIVKGSNQ